MRRGINRRPRLAWYTGRASRTLNPRRRLKLTRTVTLPTLLIQLLPVLLPTLLLTLLPVQLLTLLLMALQIVCSATMPHPTQLVTPLPPVPAAAAVP